MISDEEARDLRLQLAKLEKSFYDLRSILLSGFIAALIGWLIQHFG